LSPVSPKQRPKLSPTVPYPLFPFESGVLEDVSSDSFSSSSGDLCESVWDEADGNEEEAGIRVAQKNPVTAGESRAKKTGCEQNVTAGAHVGPVAHAWDDFLLKGNSQILRAKKLVSQHLWKDLSVIAMDLRWRRTEDLDSALNLEVKQRVEKRNCCL
jgi:hypothetical protein